MIDKSILQSQNPNTENYSQHSEEEEDDLKIQPTSLGACPCPPTIELSTAMQ